jgi:ABC-type microcin C transport system permease subunit YejE
MSAIMKMTMKSSLLVKLFTGLIVAGLIVNCYAPKISFSKELKALYIAGQILETSPELLNRLTLADLHSVVVDALSKQEAKTTQQNTGDTQTTNPDQKATFISITDYSLAISKTVANASVSVVHEGVQDTFNVKYKIADNKYSEMYKKLPLLFTGILLFILLILPRRNTDEDSIHYQNIKTVFL